ncbi:MAG: carboxypeptidase-like regulatory domain-containing protein [Pirellulaceae bacterium]
MTKDCWWRLVCKVVFATAVVFPVSAPVIGQETKSPLDSGIRADEKAIAKEEEAPVQKYFVREKFAGWQEADASQENGLGETLRSNWVMLTPAGLLNGRLVPSQSADISNVLISLLHRGQIVNQTRTDAEGNFSFNNLVEGSYSLVGFGPNAFFAFGLNILDHRASTAETMPSELLIRAVQNKNTINLDWIRHFSTSVQFRIFGTFVSREGTEDPKWLYGMEGLPIHGPTAVPATTIQSFPAKLGPNGELVGRIHQIDEKENGRPVDVRATRVMLLQENSLAHVVSADNFGVFRFFGVAPGDYSLVAAGSDGVGCIGVELIQGDAESRVLDFTLVSPDTIGWLNSVAIETAYQRIINRKVTGIDGPQNCNQFQGDISSLYRNRNNGFRKFWDTINCYFDMTFYGETFTNPQNQNPNGINGGGMGCNQCGGAGCPSCQGATIAPDASIWIDNTQGFAVPAPLECGGCGRVGCPSCGHHHGPQHGYPVHPAQQRDIGPEQLNAPTPTPARLPEPNRQEIDPVLFPAPLGKNTSNGPARR